MGIPGFTEEETKTLRDAQRRGLLSERQQREVIERHRAASLEQLTQGFVSRAGFTAVGGTAGAAVGAGAGGLGSAAGGLPGLASAPGRVQAGALGGGALGSAIGSLTFDTLEDALKAVGILQGPQASLRQRSQQAAAEGALDLSFSLAGGVILRPLRAARTGLARLFGLTSEDARSITATADAVGVGLGAVDVGGNVPKGFNRIVNVFPFTGNPARRRFIQKQGQVQASIVRLLDDLAPNAIITSELGVDMAEAATRTSTEFWSVSGRNYAVFDGLAAAASTKEIIPTSEARQLAVGLAENADLGRIFLEDNKELPEAVAEASTGWLRQLANLPEEITIGQYRRLTRDLQNLMDKMEAAGLRIGPANDMKKALESGLNNINFDVLPEAEAVRLKEALETANRFYTLGMSAFETPTAGRFRRVDKNIFRAGRLRSGTINADEIARVALNMNSPKAIDDLERLVGPDLVRQAGRLQLERAFTLATEEVAIGADTVRVFNPTKFESALGLEGLTKDRALGFNALLSRAGADLENLRDLIRVSKSIEGIGDPNTFLARRVGIAGAAGTLAAFGFGVSQFGGDVALSSAALMAVTARWGSQIMSDPNIAKSLVRAWDTAASDSIRAAAWARVLKFVRQQSATEILEAQERGEPVVAPPITP